MIWKQFVMIKVHEFATERVGWFYLG